jgi:endonuclease YncB( thermonuclease family)
MWHRFIIFLLLFPLVLACPASVVDSPASLSGKVIGVKDGDTIDLYYNEKKLTIRLAHIDCPEKKQPYGQVAKQFVSVKCFGQIVTIQHNNEYDRSKRLIGEVILANGQNLNKELVKEGLAWHFKKYSDDRTYAALEQEARKQHIGLWSEPNPVAPWEWRK